MISIIIPNFNGKLFLKPCLDSIISQSFQDYEVIIVDNASSDGSVDYIMRNYPSIKVLANSQNRGYAGGCNDGWKHAGGDFILMLNSDTILAPNCLNELNSAFQIYPSYGMYAPKILYPDGKINAAGCELSLSGSSWERGKGETDIGKYDLQGEVFGPYGAAAVFSRDLLEKTGGFDEDFFLFVEETDLSFRARLMGYRCRYIPNAVIFHYHGATAGRTSDLALYHLHRNIIWFIIKDYPLSLFIFAFPMIIGRTFGVLLYYWIIGRGKIINKAKWDALTLIKTCLKKRGRVMENIITVRWFSIIHIFGK